MKQETYTAPEVVNTLMQVYIELQKLVTKEARTGSMSLAIQTDSLRASIRNTLSRALGIEGQQLQESVESNAFQALE